MTIDIPFIILKWEASSICIEAVDPSDFLYETHGKILCLSENDKETLVGKFRLYYADIENASEEGFTAFEVLDSHSHSAEYCRSIYGLNGSEFNKKLLTLLNFDVMGNNLLIIDRLEILPKYRGKNLGLIITRRLIQRFSFGAGVVVIKPFPLQFEHEPSIDNDQQWHRKMQFSGFSKSERLSLQKLYQYYSKLGFIRMPGVPFMFRSTVLQLPTIEDLCT